MIVANHLKAQGRKKELYFVPITVNYDRVVEGEVFPNDLLGEKPVKESFFRTVKHLSNVKKGMGKVVVQYG
jgi:glycerol-3-phosphate O-acyltransferase